MKAIRLKIRVKKQAEKELIKMVNNGDPVQDQVKKIQDLRDEIGALKPAKEKEDV